MTPDCPELNQCKNRRISDAEHRGEVLAKLESIASNVGALWEEMRINRGDIKNLYFKIGLISGGTSLVVSLIVSLIVKGVK